MNVVRTMILTAVGCLAYVGAEAQAVDCTTSTKLVCLVPFRTGASNSGATAQASIFSGPIGAQLSQLPLAAAAPGAAILTLHGNPQAYSNLGPVLLDRPDSVGRGHLVFGFSAQEFNFNHLDGIGIGSIPLVYQVSQKNANGISVPLPEYYVQNIHTSLKYNQYVMLATYGLPKKTDLSVIVPYTRISIGAAPQYQSQGLYLVNGQTVTPGPAAAGYTSGTASGVGDMVVNIKHVLWSGGEVGRGSLATGMALRFPTGDALNYLGSGAYGVNLYGLAAYKARFSPHLKVAYQWNTSSVLLNIGGTGSNPTLPGGLQTALGADFGASRHFTLSADVLSNEFQNSPGISQVPFSSTLSGAGLSSGGATAVQSGTPCSTIIPAGTPATTTSALGALCTVTAVNKTFTTANFSAGVKWKPLVKKGLVLYANVLLPVNDVGLRSDPSPSVGISYNLGGLDKWPKWLYRDPYGW